MKKPAVIVDVEMSDLLEDWCREIVIRIAKDHLILIMSQEDETQRSRIESWLDDHDVRWDRLYFCPSLEQKFELYEKIIRDEFNILFVLDDHSKVVNMWRDQGLTCLQCAPGDF